MEDRDMPNDPDLDGLESCACICLFFPPFWVLLPVLFVITLIRDQVEEG